MKRKQIEFDRRIGSTLSHSPAKMFPINHTPSSIFQSLLIFFLQQECQLALIGSYSTPNIVCCFCVSSIGDCRCVDSYGRHSASSRWRFRKMKGDFDCWRLPDLWMALWKAHHTKPIKKITNKTEIVRREGRTEKPSAAEEEDDVVLNKTAIGKLSNHDV